MRYIFLFFFFYTISFSSETPYECNQIFEIRKNELQQEIEKIDEARQAYEALRAATNALLDKKRGVLEKKEKDINATMKLLEKKQKDIKELIAKNRDILKAIKDAKDDKIAQTYSKMKDQAAADILSKMPEIEAARILFNLKSKKISKIMAKMSPQKASSITQILIKGPPFNTK